MTEATTPDLTTGAAAVPAPGRGKAFDEILSVLRYCREDSGEVLVKCPHCGWTIGLQNGEFKGEQFHHRVPSCGGWLEVSFDAKRVRDAEQL